MTKVATLLIVALTHHGYWIGGQSEKVILHPAVQGGLPRAEGSYELRAGAARLAAGGIGPAGESGDLVVRLDVPKVFQRTTLSFVYRITVGGKEMETGQVPVSVFPDELLKGSDQRLRGKKLIVWDTPEGLPKLLDRSKVPYVRTASAGKLQFLPCDILLVGADQVDNSPFTQAPLLNLAEAGASVMLFKQTRPHWLLENALVGRKPPPALDWRMEHPLLSGFTTADVQSWIAEADSLEAIRIAARDPGLSIASYPRENARSEPRSVDSMLVTRSIGKGRIVLCQLPLEDFSSDPRSQILLSNAIDYLLTPPQPTPPAAEPPIQWPIAVKQPRMIPINGED